MACTHALQPIVRWCARTETPPGQTNNRTASVFFFSGAAGRRGVAPAQHDRGGGVDAHQRARQGVEGNGQHGPLYRNQVYPGSGRPGQPHWGEGEREI